MRIKVSVAELRKKVVAAKDKAVVEHQAALKKYEADSDKYRTKVIEVLEKALATAKGDDGKLPGEAWNGRLDLHVGVQRPSKPSLNTAKYDRDLSLLDMCSETVLSITADGDFGCYL